MNLAWKRTRVNRSIDLHKIFPGTENKGNRDV
jgi:hypothetical protein